MLTGGCSYWQPINPSKFQSSSPTPISFSFLILFPFTSHLSFDAVVVLLIKHTHIVAVLSGENGPNNELQSELPEVCGDVSDHFLLLKLASFYLDQGAFWMYQRSDV